MTGEAPASMPGFPEGVQYLGKNEYGVHSAAHPSGFPVYYWQDEDRRAPAPTGPLGPEWREVGHISEGSEPTAQETNAALIELLHDEQESLWGDLADAWRMASNTYWSIGMEGIVQRLLANIKAVGPVDPGRVTWDHLYGGIYATVLRLAGHEAILTPDLVDFGERGASQFSAIPGYTRAAIDKRFADTNHALIDSVERTRRIEAEIEADDEATR